VSKSISFYLHIPWSCCFWFTFTKSTLEVYYVQSAEQTAENISRLASFSSESASATPTGSSCGGSAGGEILWIQSSKHELILKLWILTFTLVSSNKSYFGGLVASPKSPDCIRFIGCFWFLCSNILTLLPVFIGILFKFTSELISGIFSVRWSSLWHFSMHLRDDWGEALEADSSGPQVDFLKRMVLSLELEGWLSQTSMGFLTGNLV